MSVPDHLEAIDAAWMTASLRAAGLLREGRVVTLERGPAAGGLAVTGCLARFVLGFDGDPGEAPASLVVKLPNPDFAGASPDDYECEARFLRELAPGCPFDTPRCYYSEVARDGSPRFVLLLEDLCGCQPGHPLEGLGLEDAETLAARLARFHASTWGASSQTLAWREWPHRPARGPALAARLLQAWPQLLKRYGDWIPAGLKSESRRLADSYPMAREQLETRGPRALIHHDIHVENMLLDRRGGELKIYLLDWQDAHIAHPAYDVAYAVSGNVTPACQREHLPRLLRRYHEELVGAGVSDYGLDALTADWQAAALVAFVGDAVWLGEGYQPPNERDRRVLAMELERHAVAAAAALALPR